MMSLSSFRKSLFLLLILGLPFIPKGFAQDPDFHIYICFGQSNMEGQGTIEAQDQAADSRFRILQAVNCSGKPAETWRTATPPLARCNTRLGPADYFGREMVKNLPPNIKIGIVQVAIAGSKIEIFDKTNYASYIASAEQYIKDIAASYGGNPYGRLVSLSKIARQDGVIKGILMHQGESNTGDAAWPNKVKAVYENLLKDLDLNAVNVPLLAGQVVDAAQGGLCASHNTIINRLPATIPTSHVISSAGCTDQADNLHFTSAGYRLLGTRYAQKMLSLLPSTPAPDTSGLKIIKTSAPVTIDGVKENAWSGAEDNLLQNRMFTVDNETDASAKVNVLYDDQFLYVLYTVTDNLKKASSANFWENDGVELYIDGNNDKSEAYDVNDHQFVISYDGSQILEGHGKAVTGIIASATQQATGYIIEMKIPWSLTGVYPAANKTIGLDFHVNDSDLALRDGKLSWFAKEDNAYSNPGVFGEGKFQNLVVTDLKKGQEKSGIFLFPNPAEDMVQVSGLQSDFNYSVFDSCGKAVLTGSGNSSIQVELLPPGLYALLLETGTKRQLLQFIKK